MSSVSERTVLGIDLAGVTGKTGYVALTGSDRPRLTKSGLVKREKQNPKEGERRLRELVDSVRPNIVAIDAPLTLPPCTTCSASCQGPGDGCESEEARKLWDAKWDPLTRRSCERELRERVQGVNPGQTMGQIGTITARGVAFARSLKAKNPSLGPTHQVDLVLEVYPAATLLQLGMCGRPAKNADPKQRSIFYGKTADELAREINGLDEESKCRSDDDVFDALIAAYTGWLHPDGLEQPPSGFDQESGWIWFPKAKAV